SNNYEALSYVWGSENNTRAILVDGCSFLVTLSLESALRQLRHSSCERVLWIDQLCIDQNNEAEKSEQVGLLGDIYRNASAVLIWLGSRSISSSDPLNLEDFTSAECERALRLLPALSSGHLNQLSCFRQSKDGRLEPTEDFSAAFSALHRFMRMPWW